MAQKFCNCQSVICSISSSVKKHTNPSHLDSNIKSISRLWEESDSIMYIDKIKFNKSNRLPNESWNHQSTTIQEARQACSFKLLVALVCTNTQNTTEEHKWIYHNKVRIHRVTNLLWAVLNAVYMKTMTTDPTIKLQRTTNTHLRCSETPTLSRYYYYKIISTRLLSLTGLATYKFLCTIWKLY